MQTASKRAARKAADTPLTTETKLLLSSSAHFRFFSELHQLLKSMAITYIHEAVLISYATAYNFNGVYIMDLAGNSVCRALSLYALFSFSFSFQLIIL